MRSNRPAYPSRRTHAPAMHWYASRFSNDPSRPRGGMGMSEQRKPDFLVIGAQKAASTFLHEFLADHPEVYMPNGETPYYQDPDYGSASEAFWSSIFKYVKRKTLGIMRPDYLAKKEAPQRVASELPSAKLIVVLCNPVDRFVSAYFHYIRSGAIPPIPIEDGLEKILNGTDFVDAHPRSIELKEYGFFGEHLENWRTGFPRAKY